MRIPHRRTRAVHIFASAVSPRYGAAASSGVGPAVASAGSARCRPGNGNSNAAPKITTITAISTRFATDTSKIDQCT